MSHLTLKLLFYRRGDGTQTSVSNIQHERLNLKILILHESVIAESPV